MSETPLRVAILGVGNALNGDDAAGVLVARALLKKVSQEAPHRGASWDNVYIADAGPSPEAFTGPLRRFQPDLLIMVDAAELEERPGTVRWLEWHSAEGMSPSTHTLSPTVLSEFLSGELGCRIMLLGIQPKCLDFDAGLSKAVRIAIQKVTDELFNRCKTGEWNRLTS